MENKDLKEILISELKTMHEMIGIMEVENEAQFIAVALPNLHTALFEWLKSKQEEIEEKISKKRRLVDYGSDELEQQYEDRGFNSALDDLKPIISNLFK